MIKPQNDFVVFEKLISSHTNDRREEKNDLELFLRWLTFEYDHPMTCSISAIWVEEWCEE